MNNVQIPSYQEGLKALRSQLSEMMPTEVLQVFDTDAAALDQNHQSPLNVQVGEQAPDFILSNAVNASVRLSDLLKDQRVVLTFYRGTWCPYCNLALAQYQSVLEEIQAAGATLVAISP